MKKMNKWLWMGFILVIFSSCKKDDPDPENLTNPVPYIQVGHKWTYDVTGGLIGYDTIVNEITANNNGIYTMAASHDGISDGNAYLYYLDGYINTYNDGDTKKDNQKLMKWLNPQVGDIWTRVTATETYTHELVSVNETVTVPAGTFTCKKVHITFANSFNDQYTYWNDNYGIIKIENLLFDMELAYKNF